MTRYQTYVHERNWGARVTEFEYRGYAMVALENRFLRVVVAAGKGTDIVEFVYKPLDIDFMWRSYTGLRDTRNLHPTIANPHGSFLDFYPGGWQEMLPNGGMDCIYKGDPLGVHGEICLSPWKYHLTKNTPEEVAVTFCVRGLRTPFYVEKTLSINSNDSVLLIDEVVRNEADEDMDFMWGHHPALGWPFLDESCRIYLPACRVRTPEDYAAPSSRLEKGQDTEWPMVKGRRGETIDLSRIPPPEVRSHDMAYLYDLEDGWYALVNSSRRSRFWAALGQDPFPLPLVLAALSRGNGIPVVWRQLHRGAGTGVFLPSDVNRSDQSENTIGAARGRGTPHPAGGGGFCGARRHSQD